MRLLGRPALLLLVVCITLISVGFAQDADNPRGSRNLTLHAHLQPTDAGPLGHVALDQAAGRSLAYLAHPEAGGFSTYDLEDPASPRHVMTWAADVPNVRAGELAAFKHAERFYLVQTFSSADGAHPAAILFDVTDVRSTQEATNVAALTVEGGLTSVFPYKHSDGRSLLFATGGADLYVYDIAEALAGRTEASRLLQLPTPEQIIVGESGFEDMFVGYHVDMEQDRLYAAGAGGYYVYDVTDPTSPEQLTHVRDAAVTRGHGIQSTPDGRHIVTTAGYRTAPIRIFDLQPALDGTVPQVRTAIGAWAADWRNHAINVELRWPYLFVASLHDGFQVVNMRVPEEPYTKAYYHTWMGTPGKLADPDAALRGAWDVDVRNHDGLIVVSDLDTGLWVFSLAPFKGWHGHGWGLPHVSSVQDWDNGPDGTQ